MVSRAGAFVCTTSALSSVRSGSGTLGFGRLASVMGMALSFKTRMDNRIASIIFATTRLVEATAVSLADRAPIVAPLGGKCVPMDKGFRVRRNGTVICLRVLPSALTSLGVDTGMKRRACSTALTKEAITTKELCGAATAVTITKIGGFASIVLHVRAGANNSARFLSAMSNGVCSGAATATGDSSVSVVSCCSTDNGAVNCNLYSPSANGTSAMCKGSFVIS